MATVQAVGVDTVGVIDKCAVGAPRFRGTVAGGRGRKADEMPWMDRHNGMMNWWMPGWGWLVVLLVLVAVVALVVWLAMRGAGGTHQPGGRSGTDALHVLEERFARGEIDREEFEARRAALREDST